MSDWNFFTNYGHIIFLLSSDEKLTVRDMATQVGITERAVQKIIHDLEADGFIKISKDGRNNSYKVNGHKKLRHDVEKGCRIDELTDFINSRRD